MLSAFYGSCIYSSALQTKEIEANNMNSDQTAPKYCLQYRLHKNINRREDLKTSHDWRAKGQIMDRLIWPAINPYPSLILSNSPAVFQSFGNACIYKVE